MLCCSVSAAGAALARRLPYEHRAGRLVETVRAEWGTVDALVLIGGDRAWPCGPWPRCWPASTTDPAVVCVDDQARFAIALCGGHQGGANDLARQVAAVLGAEAVVTTATDGSGPAGASTTSPGSGPRATSPASPAGGWTGPRRRGRGTIPLSGWPLPAALADVRPGAGRGRWSP